MSGIEVIGVVLGIFPLLVEGLRAYKLGSKTITLALRKRILVDSLCRTLQGAAVTLEELLKKVLLLSGNEAPFRPPEETESILSLPEVKDDLAAYLNKGFDILVFDIIKCYEILHGLTTQIASYVPAWTSDALVAILNANSQVPKGEISLVSRMKLAFGLKDLEKDCQELGERIEKMDLLVRLVSENQELSGFRPSRKAKRMARMQRIRKNAADLHTAVCNGWEPHCRQHHEAKLRLLDRLDGIKQTRPKTTSHQKPLHIFDLVFVGESPSPLDLWYEAAVHVFESPDDEFESQGSVSTSAKVAPQVRVTVVEPATPVTPETSRTKQIDGICSFIQQAIAIQQQPVFVLSSRHRLDQSIKLKRRLDLCQSNTTMPLSVLLRDGKDVAGEVLASSFK